MWRRTRSALFVDFENIQVAPTPGSVSSLLAWIEDGKFDADGKRRRLLARRIYWNSTAEKHRDVFVAAGFDEIGRAHV